MKSKPVMSQKLIRITTVPMSLKILLKGQLGFMQQNGFDVLGVSASGPDLQLVQQDEGIRVAAIEMTRTIAPLKDAKALWLFYKLCKKEKPAMVHSHTPKAGIIAMLGAKMAGVPHRLHTVAGLPLMEAKGIKRSVLNAVEKLTYWCATAVYPNSKGLYQFIVANQFTHKNKVKVLANGSSNGIDTNYFNCNQVSLEVKQQLSAQLNIQPTAIVFVFVGRLVADKGINELLQAFKKLQMQHANCKLLLVGPLESDLDPLQSATLNEINHNKAVIHVGYQKDVRPYLAIAHILTFPSYREGFPNVVMQAGAMNLPAIVTNINGCNEIISEGENGFIIPPKNTDALYEAMVKMIENPELRSQLAQNARQSIVSRFEQHLVWDALLKEYEKQLMNDDL
jgi:glycosyltransferase involved in cell wall biosynthesis